MQAINAESETDTVQCHDNFISTLHWKTKAKDDGKPGRIVCDRIKSLGILQRMHFSHSLLNSSCRMDLAVQTAERISDMWLKTGRKRQTVGVSFVSCTQALIR